MLVRETLGKVALLSDVLSPRQLDELAAKCRTVDYGAGAVLMAEGDFGSFMVAIVSGSVEVSVARPTKGRRGIARLGPGDIVGEMSLMTGARRRATVTATEPTRVVEIHKVALEALFVRAPELIDRFGAVLAARTAELERLSGEERAGPIREAIRRFFGR